MTSANAGRAHGNARVQRCRQQHGPTASRLSAIEQPFAFEASVTRFLKGL
jgi:hypothetical protein